MKKGTLEYYMAQDYPVEIRRIPDNLGGGYSASIPFLGRWAFFAEGDTIEEALAELEQVKRDLFEDMISRNKTIPPPPPSPEEESQQYNGRLLIRIPLDLHRELALRAQENACSINQYIATALARQVSGEQCAGAVAKAIQSVRGSAKEISVEYSKVIEKQARVRSMEYRQGGTSYALAS